MANAHPFPAELTPTAQRIADWVEFRTLQQRKAFKRGDLRSAIQIETVTDPELLETNTWQVLHDRSELFGTHWPLQISGSRVTRRPAAVARSSLDFYRYLLLLGMGEVDKEDRQLFELLVGHAVSALTQHPSMRLGAPARPDMHQSFRRRVDQYALSAGLVERHEYVAEPLPTDKDYGLDVVSWFPFEDNRSGLFHIIAQCATGDDWKYKLDELHVPAWNRHINWAVPPLRVLGVPFTLSMIPVRWVRMCTRAGLVIDRVRLMDLDRREPMAADLMAEIRARLRTLSA